MGNISEIVAQQVKVLYAAALLNGKYGGGVGIATYPDSPLPVPPKGESYGLQPDNVVLKICNHKPLIFNRKSHWPQLLSYSNTQFLNFIQRAFSLTQT
jgi:hypothetical protein